LFCLAALDPAICTSNRKLNNAWFDPLLPNPGIDAGCMSFLPFAGYAASASRGRVDRLVAQEPTERCAQSESHPLHPLRREGEPHVVIVGAGDDGQPQRVRHALPVRLAVGREAEHRLDQPLELERRPDLADEVRLVVAGVPELVRRPRGGW
jgi:hypothetical protein